MNWSNVVGEFDTIRAVAAGKSLARFGDGELKLCFGKGYSREPGSPRMAGELREILVNPGERCLPAIPTMDPAGPKIQSWLRHRERFEAVLSDGVTYYSAFVSRPDSSPWIDCREYAELVQSIWVDKRVAVVAEKGNSLLHLVRRSAASLLHVPCPSHEAYAQIDRLMRQVRQLDPDVVILSAGPTATCMAHRLSLKKVHAVDLGSAGGFLRKLLA